jgi:S-adenosylmethionine decarboxylase
MQVGSEWLVDATGCHAGALRDLRALRRLCEHVLADLALSVVGAGTWHQFPPPGGLTGLYLLTESHLACHTYPELGVATFNLYCCSARPRWGWAAALGEVLGATDVRVRVLERGGPIGPGGAP